MAATLGLYFAGMTKEEANQVRARLNELAASLGYVAKWGPTQGCGNAAALMVAIAKNEVRVSKAEGQQAG